MFDWDTETGFIRLRGDIGGYFDGGVSDQDIMGALDAMGGRDIWIELKSDGGDVFEGLSIYNQLSKYAGSVTIEIDSLAASIASVIAMAGDDVAIHESSFLMIHNPWTVAAGDAAEFRSVANVLDMIGRETAGIYAKKSGGEAEAFLAMMTSDTYLTSAEAEQLGLVDRVLTGGVAGAKREPVVSAASFPKRTQAGHTAKLAKMRRQYSA